MLSVAVWAIFLAGFCPRFVNAAWTASPKVVVANEIPYGENESALLTDHSTVTGLLCVESLQQEDLRVDLTVESPFALALPPGTEDGPLRVMNEEDRSTIRASFSLQVEGQKWFTPFTITVRGGVPPGDYAVVSTVRVAGADGAEELRHATRVKVVPREGIAGLFDLGEVILPSDEKGEPEERRERNSIVIKGEKSVWRNLMEDPRGVDRMQVKPSAYVTVPVANHTPCRAVLLVRMDVTDLRNGKRVPGFEIPYAAEHGDALGEEAVYRVEDVEPDSIERVVLPVFTNEDLVEPGTYAARISAFLFGTNMEVGHRDVTVQVVGTRRLSMAMTLLALFTSVAATGFAGWKRERFFDMRGRELILIALFGTAIFAVVNIPGTLLANLANVLLGPFSFLITGFFYETLFYILLASLVVLIPRPGVVSLVIAVRFLLACFVMGEFSPLGVLHQATSAAFLEAAVYFLGLTRKPAPSNRPGPPGSSSGSSLVSGRQRGALIFKSTVPAEEAVAGEGKDARGIERTDALGERKMSTGRIVLAATVLGLVDVFLSFISFNLNMFLYRLHYAAWYMAVYLAVNGFLLTFIAVPFGFKLGNRLKATTIG